jgi:predicted ATPase
VAVHGLGQLGQQRLSRYRFRHSLFQQYLYQHLDGPERAYLHEAVGTILEEIYRGQTEQVAIQLAHHFQQAGLRDKAVCYRLQAGKSAPEQVYPPDKAAA